MEALTMTATKADPKKQRANKYNPAARPPVRLSKEDRELLDNLKPGNDLMEYVSTLAKLKIIDGSTCGL
jgi:hypothetical protein